MCVQRISGKVFGWGQADDAVVGRFLDANLAKAINLFEFSK